MPLAAVALLAACSGSGRPADSVAYDSAGVHIAESAAPLWAAGGGWTIGEAPDVAIGVIDGPDVYQFTDVATAWQRPDGRIVVADRGARDIRIFDGSGTFQASFGGAGEGPGEFRQIAAVARYRGDSIAVWDAGLRRLSVFDAAGALGRVQPISLPTVQHGAGDRSFGLPATFHGAFDDGSLAFAPMMVLRYPSTEQPLFERPIVRISPDGDSLGAVGAYEVAELRGPERPFARAGSVVTAGDRLYAGTGDGFDVRAWSRDGSLQRIVRVPDARRPVHDVDRASFAAWYRDRQRAIDRPDDEIDRALAGATFPAELPPYAALVVDDTGRLWAEEYRLEADPRPTEWNVFDVDGRWLGRVTLPPRFTVHHVGNDFIVGVRDHDVPIVERYTLDRAGNGSERTAAIR